MSPCEPCARQQGLTTACGYCTDFMSGVNYPVKKSQPKKINIASGEDAGINYVNQDDHKRVNQDDCPAYIYL